MNKEQFESYYQKLSEPDKKTKGYIWSTAIGLQQVDQLETSDYLRDLAVKNIEGKISLIEVNQQLQEYYKIRDERKVIEKSATKEADIVAGRIAELLADGSFSLSVVQLLNIHGYLFKGIYDHAGKFRTYNISKSEWILNGDTVIYGSWQSLRSMIEYDLNLERNFKYAGLPMQIVVQHIARFVANLWQIHPFGEGNTRTTAVFLIKYLRTKGFDVTNDMFEKHSWYFRNALVRANYSNYVKSVDETTEYLEMFLDNLLDGANYVLSNRELKIKA